MASSSVPGLLVSPLLALTACAGWPRFADPDPLPPAFEKYPVAFELSETQDFPPSCEADDCAWAPPDERVPLDHLFEAARVTGTIDASAYDDQSPFGSLAACEGAEPNFGINGKYGGDLDFVQVGAPTAGGMCLVLAPADEAAADAPGLWDVVVYPYDSAAKCVSGDFLSRGKDGLAASTSLGGSNFAVLSGAGTTEYLVMIGIASGTSAPWGYELYLLPTRDDPRSCLNVAHEELTAEDFEEIQ